MSIEEFPRPEDHALIGDLVASARILALEGHEQFFLGHVSSRVPGRDGLIYMKRSGLGLGDVTERDFLTLTIEGDLVAGPNDAIHHETPIHTEIYRARPDVACVIHTHPPHAAAFSSTDADFMAVSQDSIPFIRGVPRYPSARLVSSKQEGAELAEVMGAAPAVVMTNHGITVAGRDVPHATFLAVSLERSLATQLKATAFGTPTAIPPDEAEQMAAYFDQHYQGRTAMVWRFLVSRVRPV